MFVSICNGKLAVLHRDAYVLRQGFWTFYPTYGILREIFFHEMKPIKLLQYSKLIFDLNIKLLNVQLILKVKNWSKNANIPEGQIDFEREK